MQDVTVISSSIGGVMIGLASASVLVLQGRVVGVSGICGSLLRPVAGDIGWRVGFVVGLMAVGLVGAQLYPAAFSMAGAPGPNLVVVAGLLVGFGTRLGNGCTSGHGVCGVSRLSRRSIAATLTFMASGAATVFVMRHLLGGGG